MANYVFNFNALTLESHYGGGDEGWRDFTIPSQIPSNAYISEASVYLERSMNYSVGSQYFRINGVNASTSGWTDLTNYFRSILSNRQGTLHFEWAADSNKIVIMTLDPIRYSIVYSIPYTACTAPTSVSVNNTNVSPGTTVTLSWSGASAGSSNPIKHYNILRATEANGTYGSIGTTTATYASVAAPSAYSASYYYKIQTIGTVAGYDSPYSGATATLTTIPQPPNAPTGLSLSQNNVPPNTNATLSWNAPSAVTGNAVTGYQVQRSTDNSNWTNLGSVQAATAMIVASSGTANTSYFYRVISIGQHSNSSASGSIEYKTYVGTIAAPQNVKINNLTSLTLSPDSAVTITWSASPNATNNNVTGYHVYRNSIYLGQTGASVLSFNTTAPTDEGTYTYVVYALGQLANSEASSAVSLTVSLSTNDASTFTLGATVFDAGTSFAATVTSQTSAPHKYKIDFGAYSSGWQNLAANVTGIAFAIPLDWLNAIPNNITGQASFTLQTYSTTGVLKGQRSQAFTIRASEDIKPTLSAFTATRVNNSVPAEWGIYVVSKSQVDLAIGQGAGVYGSSIVSYRLMGAGMNISSSTPISQRSPILTSMSTIFTATVTDTRGRTKTETITVSAQAYSAPTLQTTTFRCNVDGEEEIEGTYGSARAVSTFSSVAGHNSITITAGYKPKSSSGAYTSIGELQNDTAKVFGGTLGTTLYYDVKYTVTDALGTTVTFVDVISSSQYILHFKSPGDALGVGGATGETETLDVHWKLKARRDAEVNGNVSIGGDLDVRGNIVNGEIDASNISGILSPEHGGTGKGTLKEAFAALSFRDVTADCNTAISNGRYRWGPDTLNRPPDAYGVIDTFTNTADDYNGSSNWLYQVGYSTGENTYYRHKINNGAWIPWNQYVLNGDSPVFHDMTLSGALYFSNLSSNYKLGIHGQGTYVYLGNNEIIPVLWTGEGSALLQRSAGVATIVDTGNLPIIRDWIRDTFFPVGKIWQSTSATSPASIIGGTWAEVESGRFLVAAGSGYGVGSTGGAATVSLSPSQMATHIPVYCTSANGSNLGAIGANAAYSNSNPSGQINLGIIGGGQPHENRPPYYAVYMWRRTA